MRSWMALGGACLALTVGCATEAPEQGRHEDAVTNIPETPVKEQTIGNCWIYATLGWVEALTLAHSGETLNLSESYLTYLAAFVRLTNEEFVFDASGKWMTGDFFGQAAELITRYGLMDEATFIAEEANLDRSTRQERANEAIERALAQGGALATREARSDPLLVRRVLDEAYRLPPSIVELMTQTFGEDLSRTRLSGAVLPDEIRDPARIVVATLRDGHEVTLEEAMGELDPERTVTDFRDRKERRGPYAWQRVELDDPAARPAAILRMKKALNAGFPVPIDWYTAFQSMRQSDGSFHAPVRGTGGWHESLAHDYEIEVSGHGVLPAGIPVEDPELLERTLSPDARIVFLRMKNSWGREVGPLGARGYTDASWDYLMWEFERPRIDYDERPELGIGISALILPPESWEGATH